jgi:hypothetical protein
MVIVYLKVLAQPLRGGNDDNCEIFVNPGLQFENWMWHLQTNSFL